MVMPSAAASNWLSETAWIMPSKPVSLKSALHLMIVQILRQVS